MKTSTSPNARQTTVSRRDVKKSTIRSRSIGIFDRLHESGEGPFFMLDYLFVAQQFVEPGLVTLWTKRVYQPRFLSRSRVSARHIHKHGFATSDVKGLHLFIQVAFAEWGKPELVSPAIDVCQQSAARASEHADVDICLSSGSACNLKFRHEHLPGRRLLPAGGNGPKGFIGIFARSLLRIRAEGVWRFRKLHRFRRRGERDRLKELHEGWFLLTYQRIITGHFEKPTHVIFGGHRDQDTRKRVASQDRLFADHFKKLPRRGANRDRFPSLGHFCLGCRC